MTMGMAALTRRRPANTREDTLQKWRETKEQILRDEFAAFCRDEGLSLTPQAGHLFAMRCAKAGGSPFAGYTEREIIVIVAGRVPAYYDDVDWAAVPET
jgi:hypothetical protein